MTGQWGNAHVCIHYPSIDKDRTGVLCGCACKVSLIMSVDIKQE